MYAQPKSLYSNKHCTLNRKCTIKQTLYAQTKNVQSNKHYTLNPKVYSRTNIERANKSLQSNKHCTLKQIVYRQTNIVGTNKKFTVKQTLYAQTNSLPVTNTEAHGREFTILQSNKNIRLQNWSCLSSKHQSLNKTNVLSRAAKIN